LNGADMVWFEIEIINDLVKILATAYVNENDRFYTMYVSIKSNAETGVSLALF